MTNRSKLLSAKFSTGKRDRLAASQLDGRRYGPWKSDHSQSQPRNLVTGLGMMMPISDSARTRALDRTESTGGACHRHVGYVRVVIGRGGCPWYRPSEIQAPDSRSRNGSRISFNGSDYPQPSVVPTLEYGENSSRLAVSSSILSVQSA